MYITIYSIPADPELLSDHFELPSKTLGTLSDIPISFFTYSEITATHLTYRRPLKCVTLAVRGTHGYEGRLSSHH